MDIKDKITSKNNDSNKENNNKENNNKAKDIEVSTYIKKMNQMIHKPDVKAMEEAKSHLDAIAKPLDGLGRFEKMLVKIAGITGDPRIDLSSKKVLVLCSDNGIVEEGISQSGQDVTRAVAISLSKGTSSVCRMAMATGAEVIPVDMGIACDKTPEGVKSKVSSTGKFHFGLPKKQKIGLSYTDFVIYLCNKWLQENNPHWNLH